jgi:glyoxylase-like metal-dependent hydrolase (beta-lactamase superfamily II)
MQTRKIIDGLFSIELGRVNVNLIATDDALVLIDTGSPGDEEAICAALTQLGHTPQDLTHIIVTHVHADHAGSLAALQAMSDAQTIMHPIDAVLAQRGDAMRPLTPAPTLLGRILYRFIIEPTPHNIAPARIDVTVDDGDVIPVAGGIRVIHAPGHCAGQVALLWEARSVLFAADTALNIPNLGHHLAYEDFALGQKTAARLGEFSFDIACFGHGRSITRGADRTFRHKFQKRLPKVNSQVSKITGIV